MPNRLKYGLTNLRGTQVGDLKVLQRTNTKGRPRWRCECVCGKRVTVHHNRLIDKKRPKTHCGCKNRSLGTQNPIEYHTWWDARARCHKKDHPSYPSYGAQGIMMCKQWRESFEAFFEHMGKRPSNEHSIDRIDPWGHYEPGNVRWATAEEQANNKKEHYPNGKTVPLKE